MTQQAETKTATPSQTAAAALWGSVLPIPAGPRSGDDFEARDEAAWRHIKVAYFAVEEHGWLREVFVQMIEGERKREVRNDDNR